jgi:hypothetical protein
MKIKLFVLCAILGGLTACSNMYYGAMEKFGVHKREILVDRVGAARNSQMEAKKQFLTAMEQFNSLVNFQGGDLEKSYQKLDATLKKSESKAADVRNRIEAVEDVSQALFKEMALRNQAISQAIRSEKRVNANIILPSRNTPTFITAMKRAEGKLEPALVPLRDQVLFMKHNLNARAIAGLSNELISVQSNVDDLVRDIERAIAQADEFLASLQAE